MEGGVIRQQKNTILKNVNIDIASGEFVYLIGKVGSGKSSFLKTLYAELPLEYGKAEVAGFQLKKIKKSQIPLLRRKCGIVFQDFKLLIDRNVYENLEFVLKATGWKNKKAIRERIETVLTKVGMSDKQAKMPHQLSGGEQQRIVLARALLNAPPLILADEPTGNIDPETSYQLVELLKEICDTGKTIIIATHQYDLIEKFPGRVFCCEHGELYEKTPAKACECTEEVLPLPPIEEIIPDPSSEAGTIAPPNTEKIPEDTTAVNSEPETATIVEVTSETVNLTETPGQAATEIEDKTTNEDTTGDIMTLIGKTRLPRNHRLRLRTGASARNQTGRSRSRSRRKCRHPGNSGGASGEKKKEKPASGIRCRTYRLNNHSRDCPEVRFLTFGQSLFRFLPSFSTTLLRIRHTISDRHKPSSHKTLQSK